MVKEIPLTRGKVALVDDEDYEYLSQFRWSFSNVGYAVRYVRGSKPYRHSYMHREIMQAKQGQMIDHLNQNPLDNRRSNLRLSTKTTNGFNRGKNKNNTSGFKGVYWHKQGNKWASFIRCNKEIFYLGLYKDVEDAARAYDMKALELHGEFAVLNFPE